MEEKIVFFSASDVSEKGSRAGGGGLIQPEVELSAPKSWDVLSSAGLYDRKMSNARFLFCGLYVF